MVVSSPAMAADGLVYNIKISSVGPANVTGSDLIYEPETMGLAMKLHYIRGIYYFGSQAFEGLSTLVIKEPMFTWLNKYPQVCGRFRRTETGRAYLKCNDCGVRFVEAKCDKTLDEWLEMKDATLEKLLVRDQALGPELGFSPLVYIQLTKFKCGGTAVGLSWSHVLGDAFSAAEFMNMLGRAVAGYDLGQPTSLAHSRTKVTTPNGPEKVGDDPLSIKRVGPVGDHWVNVTKCKMEAFSFNVTPTQLSHLQSKLSPNGTQFGAFEALSAVIWQCIAKIREWDSNVVTICKGSEESKTCDGTLSNSQVVSVVNANFQILDSNPSELALLVQNGALDEREKIEEAMERDGGLPDFIVYGAKLTFVNLEDARFYAFEYRGQRPVNISYRIEGVGEEGTILVLPGPKGDDGGRSVMAILPENEIEELKLELKREGLMA
ncbi:protein ECERIFERUM 26-like [Sesamum indicum]|uniref:Protein ECERIFERUM 26-like n=2 Tax=Sesamum indicum TaxID=4182 RepID=A0A6I9TSF0_SESIN|nr:protein ECERIFERUM 26-like [Sesamum indicum]